MTNPKILPARDERKQKRREPGTGAIFGDRRKGYTVRIKVPSRGGPRVIERKAKTKAEANALIEGIDREIEETGMVAPLPGNRFVYFIRGVDGGPIKIGIAQDLPTRLADIQACSPVKLEVLRVVPNASTDTEAYFHAMFRKYRLHGEWFEPRPITRYLKLHSDKQLL